MNKNPNQFPNVLSLRLSDEQLARLDDVRGNATRAEYIRSLLDGVNVMKTRKRSVTVRAKLPALSRIRDEPDPGDVRIGLDGVPIV